MESEITWKNRRSVGRSISASSRPLKPRDGDISVHVANTSPVKAYTIIIIVVVVMVDRTGTNLRKFDMIAPLAVMKVRYNDVQYPPPTRALYVLPVQKRWTARNARLRRSLKMCSVTGLCHSTRSARNI